MERSSCVPENHQKYADVGVGSFYVSCECFLPGSKAADLEGFFAIACS